MTTTKRAARRLQVLQRAGAAVRIESLEPRRLLAAGAHHWPAGPEMQVSSHPADYGSAMAMDAGGNYVVVWNNYWQDGTFGDIFAQRYNAAGVPQGDQFRVNTATNLNETRAAVAMDADGDFVVTWERGYSGYYYGVPYDVYAQRYDAAGVPQGTEFLVNTYTTGSQYQNSVAMDADGNFVVTWTSSYQDGSVTGIYAQRFNSAGAKQGAEFRVNSYTPQWQDSPSAAMNAHGDFVISWRGSGLGESLGIQAQRFNAAGVPQGTEFLVSDASNWRVHLPSIAMDENGDFVVAWQVSDQYIRPYGIAGRRYNANGVPQGDLVGVEGSATWRPGAPDVAMNALGEFVVTWESSIGDSTYSPGAYVQRYDAAGLPLGTRFRVNTAGNLRAPSVAISNGGDFVVAASAPGAGIRARAYTTFGSVSAAMIGDRVWNDSNADGIQGAGEVGIGGALVEFLTADGAGIAIVPTSSSGQYSLAALPGASAQLRFITPAGFLPTRQDQGSDDQLDSDADRVTGLTPIFTVGAAGTSNNSFDAGFCLPASVGGIIFNDRNGNGVRDGSEEGLPGFQVFADLDGDGVHGLDEPVNASDNSGRYLFTGLLGGTYSIIVLDQDLWIEPALPPVAIPPGAALNQIDRPVRTSLPDKASAPQGSEFRINSHTTGDQGFPAIATDADGDFVVAWSGTGQGDDSGIFAQRYNASGVKQGLEFRVNTYTTGSQNNASAAMDGDGGFIIAWQSDGQDGSSGGIYAQRYNAAGVTQGSEFRVNTYTIGNQGSPAAAMDASGDFVVTWHSYGQDGSFAGIYAQRYNAAGVAQGTEFRVNTGTTLNEITPTVAMDADGDFVISWSSGYLGYYFSVPYQVYAQRYRASGVAEGTEFKVSSSTTLSDLRPAAAMDADGDFVVTWARGFSSYYGSELDVYAQRYNASGVPQGTPVQVNSVVVADAIAPSVAMSGQGDWVVAWHDTGIAAQRYNAAGVRQGAALHVNSYTTGAKDFPAAAIDANGNFVIAWRSSGQDGSGSGVYAQRYTTFGAPQAAAVGDRVWNDTNGNGIQDAGEPGIAGATVELYTADGVFAAATTTNATGQYTLSSLAGTSVFVRFVTPAGLIPTRRDQGADDELDSDADRVTGRTPVFVTGAPGTTNGGLDAGFVVPASISGIVFFDRSGDGVHNGGDEPLAGFQIFADVDGDGIIDADEPVAISSADGAYTITQALSGTYPISIVDQDLWVEPVLPPTVVPLGGNVAQINFPVRTSASDSVSAPLGAEVRVSSNTTAYKTYSQVAMDANGNYVVAWNSYLQDGGDWGVYAQRYNAAGAKQGSEFRVNTYTTGTQFTSSASMDADGDFVITWYGAGSGDNYGIFAQRYNAGGVKQGSEFRVNTYTTNEQYLPSAAMDANGSFLITWQSQGQDGSNWGAYAQRYNAAGVPQGSEFRVNAYTTGDQQNLSASMDNDGDFLIAWSGAGEGDDAGIYAQRYNTAGTPQGSEFRINSYTTGEQTAPSTEMDATGNFVVTWNSRDQDGSGNGVYAQRYSAAGVRQGAPFQVNSYTNGSQHGGAVAMDAAGNFVVTWQSADQDGSDYGVYAQRYNAAGVPQGGEFRANTHTPNHQRVASAAMDADGDFVLAWSSYYQAGAFASIYARRYDVSARPAITASPFVWQTAPQRIEFTFDQNVSASLSTADLVLRNLTTSTTIPSSSIVMSWNATTRTATFRFPTLPNGGSLPDGEYRATLAAAGVSNAAGTTIAVDYALDFFVLAGDANHDGRVNLTDFNILAANFGQSNRDFTQGDFNYDGTVNLQDFNLLAGRFGAVVGAPASSKAGGTEVSRIDQLLRDREEIEDVLGTSEEVQL